MSDNAAPTNLGAHHIAILLVLDGESGFATGRVSELAGFYHRGDNRRIRSGACRSWLYQLEKLGLVGRLDNLKPVAWVLTKAGAALIASLPSSRPLPSEAPSCAS